MYAGERKLLCWEGNSFYDRGFPDRVVRVLKPAGCYGLWFSNPTLERTEEKGHSYSRTQFARLA